MTDSPDSILKQLADVIEARKHADAETSYVARLLALGSDAILKKIGEEATETVMAAKDADADVRSGAGAGAARTAIVNETADLWFHCLVMLAHYGLRPEDVLAELARRAGTSGLDEKALRKVKNAAKNK